MQFHDILSITTKEYCLIFSGTLRSGYGIAKAHFVYFEKKHPQIFLSDLKPYCNRFYVDEVYVLFSLEEHLVASGTSSSSLYRRKSNHICLPQTNLLTL